MDRAAWRATVYGFLKSWTGGGNDNPLQYLPAKSHEQRSLAGYSLWGRRSQTRLSNSVQHSTARCILEICEEDRSSSPHHTHTRTHSGKFVEVMGMLISLIVVMFSQCISKHQVVYLKNI